jgi:transcriptional regulator with XRE-family HTH domain
MNASPPGTLRAIRQLRGLSYEQLAELAGVHPDSVRRLELGRTVRGRRETRAAIADALGVNANDLFDGDVHAGA